MEILDQSDPPPVDLSIGVIWFQIAAEWLQIAQRSQWRAYRKPPWAPNISGHDLDLSGSRDVISHVTVGLGDGLFPIGRPLDPSLCL